jgi:hypothetical protein
MAQTIPQQVPERGKAWIKAGLQKGIIVGLIFAVFEVIVAAFVQGNAFMPLRMIGAIAIGPAALETTFPLIPALLAGVVVHLILSGIFGIIAAGVFTFAPTLAQSRTLMVITTTIYGLLLWFINFYIIPSFIFEWFFNATPMVQLVAHGLVFGVTLGFVLPSEQQLAEQQREQKGEEQREREPTAYQRPYAPQSSSNR